MATAPSFTSADLEQRASQTAVPSFSSSDIEALPSQGRDAIPSFSSDEVHPYPPGMPDAAKPFSDQDAARFTRPVGQPAQQPAAAAPPSFWRSIASAASSAASSVAHTLGLPGSMAEAREMSAQQNADVRAHPVERAAEALAGPAGQIAEGLYAGGKRSLGELEQGAQAVEEGNPTGAAVHAVQALPFVGAGIKAGSEQLEPGQVINPAEFGTALGTALQVGPMLAGGEAEGRPNPNLGVYIPRERPMLPRSVEPEYVGEPGAPPQPAGIVDAEVAPWEGAKQAQLPAKAGPGLNPPPPVNPATAVERTAPPPQFAAHPEPTPPRGMVVDPQGNVLPVRPGLPPPGETAARAKPIIPKAVPAPVQTAPAAPPQLTSSAVAVPVQPAVPVQAAPDALKPATQEATNQPQSVGAPEPATGRPVLQATDNPATLQKAAQTQAPWLERQANATIEGVKGATVEGIRDKKEPADLGEKLNKEGQPAETIPDYLGGRIVVDSPQARDEVASRIRQTMPVVRESDDFQNGGEPYGFRTHTFQVRTPDGNSAELQVVPKEVAEVNEQTHPDYEAAERARIAGNENEQQQIARQVRAKHDAAMQAFNQRNQQETAPAPIGVGSDVTYVTNGGKSRNAKVVRVDGDQAYIRDGYATVKKPIASLKVGQQPAAQNQPVAPQVGQGGTEAPKVVQPGTPPAKGDKWIGVDLDGTLAKYDGWKGKTNIGDPIPAMVDRIKQSLADGNNVKILTARVSDDPTGEAKKAIQDWTEKHLGKRLDVTDVKDAHMTHLYDDRAVPVERNTGKLLAEPQPEGETNAIEPRNGGEPSAAAKTGSEGSKENALGVESTAAVGTHEERTAGAGGTVSGPRVGQRNELQQPASEESPVKEKPLAQPGGGEKQEEVKPTKHKYGNTQADIPPNSEAGKALARARKAILPEDLAGEGMIDDAHITVRYGIDGEDFDGIRAYLEKQAPFEATLGKTQAFPPSEHSDGAAPIIAPVESADLRRMEKEIDKHGNFVERSFPEYKPHATLAYVKPEEAKRYTGMTEADGKKFTVNSVSISKKDGTTEEIQLKGKAAPSFYKPKATEKASPPVKTEADAVAPGTAEPTAHERRVAEVERLEARIEAIKAEMAGPGGMMDLPKLHRMGDERERAEDAIKALKLEIADDEREAEKIAKRDAIPLTKPEEKLVTDPDVNKWKYQAEYFVKALEPAKDAWLERFDENVFGGDRDEQWKYLVKNDPGGKDLPGKFPDQFIRIEVPGDGKFLVNNRPAAIDKLLKSAPRAFAKPGKAPTGKLSVPRAPGEFDAAERLNQLQKQLDEHEKDLNRATGSSEAVRRGDVSFHKESIAAIQQEMESLKGEPASGAAEPARRAAAPATEYLHGGIGAVDLSNALPKPIRDYLEEKAGQIAGSRELQTGMYNLESQHDADVLRAVQLMKEMPGTPKDFETIYHNLENPKEPLTRDQRNILNQYIKPLMDADQKIFEKLNPTKAPVENYVHRIAQQRGSQLERILKGSKGTGGGNLLKKSNSASKKRTMMALERPDGERQVVSVSRGRVTAWTDGVPRDIGPLRSGLTNPEEILDERLEPIERELAHLRKEQSTLSATKSRQEAASRRLGNIANRISELEKQSNEIEHEHIAENLPDRLWKDKSGTPWTFKQATTKDIEANSPVAYYKNAAASAILNHIELRKAERAYDFIENFKNDPEFGKVGIKPANPGQIPEGWKPATLPQFMGYYFEPHIADTLDWYAKRLNKEPGVWEQINNFLTTSIFLNPIAHIPNLTANWVAEKGIELANPMEMGSQFKSGLKAISAVAHQNKDFLEALDAGAALHSQKQTVGQFTDLLMKKLQDDVEKPGVVAKLRDAMGDWLNPVTAVKTMVNAMASRITWPVHDFYLLQSAYSKMANRPDLSLKDALEDTGRYLPNERVPVHIMGSKAISSALQNRSLVIFNAYHYGVLKAFGQVAKNLGGMGFEATGENAKGEPTNKYGRTADQEKFHALNILAGMALLTYVIYPQIDRLMKVITGNNAAEFRRAGYSTMVHAVEMVLKGERTPVEAIRSAVTPAPLTELGLDLATDRDILGTQRRIYDPHGKASDIAQEIGGRMAESFSPGQYYRRATTGPEGMKNTLWDLAGVSFPVHGAMKIAAEIRADELSGNVQTPAERDKSILRSQALHAAWNGDKYAISKAILSGKFNRKEQHNLIKESREQPLAVETTGMGLDDFQKVYESATSDEKQILRRAHPHMVERLSKEAVTR